MTLFSFYDLNNLIVPDCVLVLIMKNYLNLTISIRNNSPTILDLVSKELYLSIAFIEGEVWSQFFIWEEVYLGDSICTLYNLW